MADIIEAYGHGVCPDGCGYHKNTCKCKEHKFWANQKKIQIKITDLPKVFQSVHDHKPVLQGNGELQNS